MTIINFIPIQLPMIAKKKILLIDEDLQLGHAIAKALDTRKYSFFYAQTGNTGTQLALAHHPDLILCNLALESFDEKRVLSALKATSFNDHSSVFFLSEKPNEALNGYANGPVQKKVIVKPDTVPGFINAIESALQNNGAVREKRSDDFNTLFGLAPYGLFILTGEQVLEANPFLCDRLGRDQASVPWKMEEIFEKASVLKIKHWMKRLTGSHSSVFYDLVDLKDRLGEVHSMSLKLAELKTGEATTEFIGIVSHTMNEKNLIVNYQLAQELCNMLKRENLPVSQALEKKITWIIKSRTVDQNDQKKSFFTKRENEVLCLTMEGLSIKVIADKLSISSRTVEKYRTRLMEKSGAKNIAEVIVFSLKNNLVKI